MITSGGKQKPAKADCGTVAGRERRVLMTSVCLLGARSQQMQHRPAESLSKGSRVVVVGRLQQRSWTAEDGSVRSVVEVVAEELGPSLRWATATPARAIKSGSG
jgi:Single-strand binding protein family